MVQSDTRKIQHRGPQTVTKRRPRPEVQVVTCGAAFPISTKPPKPPRTIVESSSLQQSSRNYRKKKNNDGLLDWHDTVKEVRSLGSAGFTGQQKRAHVDEQYRLLTGRDKKKQHIPLPIVRGLKKKAAEREARQLQEAKEAGIVLPTTTISNSKPKQQKKKLDSTNRVHGPAPSIGFMKKGVFRVNKKK